MKKALFLLIFTFLYLTAIQAQNVQWASEVTKFSSQFNLRQYSAKQVLGKPNVLPNLGISPNAWSPAKRGKKEFIEVRFEQPSVIQQVAIAEVNNPGSIEKIYAIEPNGTRHLINEFIPRAIPIEGRLFRLFIDETPYQVQGLRVEFDGSIKDDYMGIDAIAISDSKDPITVDINISEDINNDYIPLALDSNINTTFNELKPIITPDGKTLFFSRQNYPENVGGYNDDEDIWMSSRDTITGEWTKAVNVGAPLNNKGPNFVNSVSSDGNTMLLLLGNAYYSKRKMTQGVSMSTKDENGEWGKPQNLKIDNDYNLSEKANYFLTSDKEAIVMSVERDDSYGDRDLYVSFKKNNGTWSKPINLGEVVNSADEEGSPFLASDDKTLFFSSKGFSGFGGYDIYLTRRLDDTWTNWSEPENLGAAFNSREDDIFFNFTENDEYAYFTRGSVVNTDIYKVKLPYYQKPQMLATLMEQGPNIIVAVKGRVFDSKTGKKIDANLQFSMQIDSTKINLANADTAGYRLQLKEGFVYDIKTKSPGYYQSFDFISLEGITESIEIEKDIYLDPIIKNTPVVLKNVNFDFDKSDIRKDAEPILDNLVELMYDNPEYHLTIEGHTCNMGSDAYNQSLSERRAGSVVRYIQSKGIESERLVYFGYGESRPLVSNDSNEGREINRRVAFRINDMSELGSDISSVSAR